MGITNRILGVAFLLAACGRTDVVVLNTTTTTVGTSTSDGTDSMTSTSGGGDSTGLSGTGTTTDAGGSTGSGGCGQGGTGGACSDNIDCGGAEVCGAGVCVDAQTAQYEIEVLQVEIQGPGCFNDPDELDCELEIFIGTFVDGALDHVSPIAFQTPGDIAGYVLPPTTLGSTLTFEVWDDDSDQNNEEDLLLRHTFNTPPCVLHDGILNDTWREDGHLRVVTLQLTAL